MSHTRVFEQFSRLMAAALEPNEVARADKSSRRAFLKQMASAGAVMSAVPALLESGSNGSDIDVGIAGAGLAGLVCADTLRKNGTRATLYEASTRAGGR